LADDVVGGASSGGAWDRQALRWGKAPVGEDAVSTL